jgi:hypothetical protein
MPTYPLQSLADRIRYLINQGLNNAEAEVKAFREHGLSEIPDAVRRSLDFLLTNPTANSPFARNDRDRVLDRRNAGARVSGAGGVDANPAYTTNPADFGQTVDQKGTTASPTKGNK